jgi:streptomycin 3"-adenylyltransferase
VPKLPPEPLDRILPSFVADLRATLGDELVGAYLYGSAVSGGFDPDVSDVDVVVVTATPVDAQPFERFDGIIRRLQQREPDWAGRLDVLFIGQTTLADFGAGGGPFVEISHEEGPELKRRADEWLETWYLVRAADHALAGPAPATLIPPISTDAFLHDVARGVPSFIAPERNKGTNAWLAYRTLTLCRLLLSLESREVSSKVEGAAWAMARYPEAAPLIRAALDFRSNAGRGALTPSARAEIPGLLEFLASEVAARNASTPR